jgi:hypothetical protein
MDILLYPGLLVAALYAALMIKRKARERHRRERYLKLHGMCAGVWIRQPNRSQTKLQNILEQRLTANGVQLYSLRNDACEELIRNGEWSNSIAALSIEVAIVGQLVVDQVTVQERVYPPKVKGEDPLSYDNRRIRDSYDADVI